MNDSKRQDIALLVLRLAIAATFIGHGGQLLFGLFGGPGLEGITSSQGQVMGTLVAVGEFFGGLGMLLGLLTRFTALAQIVIMLGAIVKVHLPNGFFLPKGYEYNVVLISIMVTILLLGPGKYAIGRFLPLPKTADGQPVPALE